MSQSQSLLETLASCPKNPKILLIILLNGISESCKIFRIYDGKICPLKSEHGQAEMFFVLPYADGFEGVSAEAFGTI